ncbi:MAG: NTP transferase domain-containing protein [Bacteroidales bacterium]|nr:NTP transferase domain-containing protein [Bacteroidales bacterium]
MKAFILAAGLGTRLKPFTDNKPKALVSLSGKTFLEHTVLNLKVQGINNFVINVHHFADQITDFLKEKNNLNCNIQISDERAELLDTGGALLHAKSYFSENENILIYNVDIFSDINIYELTKCHKKNNALVTLAVHKSNSSRKLVFDKNMQLCLWKNIKTGEIKTARKSETKLTDFAFTGIHIINTEIFRYITETSKFSIIDLYLRLAKKHKILAYETNYNYWFDLGKPETLKLAEIYFNNMQL